MPTLNARVDGTLIPSPTTRGMPDTHPVVVKKVGTKCGPYFAFITHKLRYQTLLILYAVQKMQSYSNMLGESFFCYRAVCPK